jgi:hypothetical protein
MNSNPRSKLGLGVAGYASDLVMRVLALLAILALAAIIIPNFYKAWTHPIPVPAIIRVTDVVTGRPIAGATIVGWSHVSDYSNEWRAAYSNQVVADSLGCGHVTFNCYGSGIQGGPGKVFVSTSRLTAMAKGYLPIEQSLTNFLGSTINITDRTVPTQKCEVRLSPAK